MIGQWYYHQKWDKNGEMKLLKDNNFPRFLQETTPRWWFQSFCMFIPPWGRWSNLTYIFFKWVGWKPPTRHRIRTRIRTTGHFLEGPPPGTQPRSHAVDSGLEHWSVVEGDDLHSRLRAMDQCGCFRKIEWFCFQIIHVKRVFPSIFTIHFRCFPIFWKHLCMLKLCMFLVP